MKRADEIMAESGLAPSRSKARALIESTDLSIGAVGAAVGIPNTTHFINLFKEKLGVTPQVYREGYRSFRQISRSYQD